MSEEKLPEGIFHQGQRAKNGRAFWWLEVNDPNVNTLDWVICKTRDGRHRKAQVRKVLSRHPELGCARVTVLPECQEVKRIPIPLTSPKEKS